MYKGNKLPPFYIESSNEASINSGYNGSVKSLKYKNIWEKERLENPHLFKTTCLSKRYNSSKEAQLVEKRLQKYLDVVKNPMYINMSIANPDGFFGMPVKGKENPFYGKTHSKEFSIKHSNRMKGKNNPMFGRTGDNCPNGRLTGKDNPFYGKTHSSESRVKCGIKNRKSPVWEYEDALYELWLKYPRH